MDLIDVINKRKSTRVFKNKKVPKEILNKAIETANLSPSAGNIQARSVIIIEDKKTIEDIPSACFYEQTWISKAPMVLVITANEEESAAKYNERGRNLYGIQDATIFASYLQLLLTHSDLESRWVGAIDEEKLNELLKTPKGKRPIIVLPLGYPDEERERKPRKTLDEIIIKEI